MRPGGGRERGYGQRPSGGGRGGGGVRAYGDTGGGRSFGESGGRGYNAREVVVVEEEQFGIVCSLRDAFGFLQPLNVSASGSLPEEHVYFPEREVHARDLKVGDEIAYWARSTQKGPQAANIRVVDTSMKVASAQLQGVVVRDSDVHRNIPGVIQMAAEHEPQFVIYTTDDCVGVSGGKVSRGTTLPRKGDEVEFVALTLPNTTYARAQGVKCIKSAREKQMSEQVKRLLDAGAQSEQGIIDTIKSGENYGFIKPADRMGNIYFRFDDFIDPEIREGIKESMEVEFFVLTESNKGKMADRAFHLKVLLPGTVLFESTVAVKATGMVIVEPKLSPREEPGCVLLSNPIRREGHPDIDRVELWARCVPEGLLFRVGDRLELDVQNYRPEKINFARNVRVLSFRKLGREVGRVQSLKKDQSFKFGFLRSSQRENDIFFHLGEVLGPNGSEFVPEANITLNLGVSFETVPDDSRPGSGPRVKAVRCRLLSDSEGVTSVSQLEGAVLGGAAGGGASDGPTLLKKNCIGVVVKDSNKKDAPGSIRPTGSVSGVATSEEPIRDVGVLMYRAELIESVDEFCASGDWKEAWSDCLTGAKRRALHALLDEKYPGIAHETIVPTGLKTGGAKKFKMWKLELAEYAAWKSARSPSGDDNDEEPTSPGGTRGASGPNGSAGGGDESDCVTFVRSDTSEELGALTKDLTVTYDLFFDPVSSRKVAKNVKLTDESIPGESESEKYGVLDSVFDRGKRFGFVRVVPNDEKLLWDATGVVRGTDEKGLNEGVEVGFSIRRRGGVRIAVNLRIVPSAQSQARETRVDGLCTGLVVEERGELAVLLIDVSQAPLLRRKYWNTERLRDMVNGGTGLSPGTGRVPDELQAGGGGTDTKLLPPLVRSCVPIDPLELDAAKASLTPGDLVQCVCVANWIRQRAPIKVSSIVKLPTGLGPRRKGKINRLNVRLRGNSVLALAATAVGETFEYSEIRDDTEVSSGSFFYCEGREIRPYFEQDPLQQGQEVEFYAVPALGLALYTHVVPKLQEVNGVSRNVQIGAFTDKSLHLAHPYLPSSQSHRSFSTRVALMFR